MPKLTNEFIELEAAPPIAGQLIYRDEDLPGFALRVTPKGKSFIVEKRVNGVNRRVTLGKCTAITVEAARKEALKILADMARGIDPITGRNGSTYGVTLGEVLEKYLSVRKLRPTTVAVYRGLITRNLPDWLDKPIIEITKDMVQLRHQALSSGTRFGTSGNATANSTMKILRSLLNFASDRFGHDDEPLLKVNPVSRLSRDRAWHVIPPRQGIIPDSKLAAWYKALLSLGNTTIRDYFLILLLTGFRRYESSTLLWTDVDFDKRIVCLRADVTKNHREHPMPMSDFLFELLTARYEKHRMSMYVFPGRNGRGRLTDFRQALIDVRERSGCRFTVHDLRRTYLTMAEKLDVPQAVIKKLANHIPVNDVTLKYIVLDQERLRKYANDISNEFVKLLCADINELILWDRPYKRDSAQLRLPLTSHSTAQVNDCDEAAIYAYRAGLQISYTGPTNYFR